MVGIIRLSSRTKRPFAFSVEARLLPLSLAWVGLVPFGTWNRGKRGDVPAPLIYYALFASPSHTAILVASFASATPLPLYQCVPGSNDYSISATVGSAIKIMPYSFCLDSGLRIPHARGSCALDSGRNRLGYLAACSLGTASAVDRAVVLGH
ncbi:hypothetical protein EDD15DRAFT_1383492 [Pisolithus albus]|nr:hypothetical protein EDD15DRAFT_1383492 [Pisolithus albus]